MRINFEKQDREWEHEQWLKEMREYDQQIAQKVQQIEKLTISLIKCFASEGDDHATIIAKLTQHFDLPADQAEEYYQKAMTPAE